MQTTSDEVLIARIAGGDRLAMQVLFARHHVRVYRFVLRLVRNDATAEDLISDVLLHIWRQEIGERRVGKECRSRCDWSSDVCSSDLRTASCPGLPVRTAAGA